MLLIQFGWEKCQEALGSRRPGLWDLAIPRKRNSPDDLHLLCEDFERTVALLRLRLSRGRGLALVADCLSRDAAEF